MPNEPKLRGRSKQRSSPYPLGEIPHSIAVAIGKRIVHRLAVGATDITGDDFGEIFAQSIGGLHRGKPLGIADVVWEGCAWSVKSMKSAKPFAAPKVRAISGRNSPNFSVGISDPYANIAATGAAVLNIWNKRVNQSLNEHDDLRIMLIVRNMDLLEFTLAEIEPTRYVASEYRWEKNSKGNLIGRDIQREEHRFTWQPGGGQFTVIHHIPASAYRFRITRRPGMMSQEHVLRLIGFEDSWIEAVTLETPPNAIPLQLEPDADPDE